MLFLKKEKGTSKMKTKYIRTDVTTEYDMFISPTHQRAINNGNIKGIMESMKEHGVIAGISVRPSIEYPGKYEVYDGQHTVAACKRLNAPVIYSVFRGVSNKAMIALNGKSRVWKMTDYLGYGVTDNIEDYKLLNRIYKQEKLPLTALVIMYGGSYGNKAFKSLNWKALTTEKGNTILKYIKDYERLFNVEHCRHARFVWGLCKVYDTGLYEHKRMINQLSKCSQLLTKQANPEDYAKNIQMVYNHGVRKELRVQFIQD